MALSDSLTTLFRANDWPMQRLNFQSWILIYKSLSNQLSYQEKLRPLLANSIEPDQTAP